MIREATSCDVEAIYGSPLDVPARLLVVDDNGPVAIGGLVWIEGEVVATCRVFNGCSPKQLLRAARRVMSSAGRVVAHRDEKIPGADRFLRRLGFVPVDGVTYERADLPGA
jgi:hypothetical protein